MLRHRLSGWPSVAWKALRTVFFVGFLLASCNRKEVEAATTRPGMGVDFGGKVTNKAMKPVAVRGQVVYDKDCKDRGGELIDCNGGIYTREFGLLNFYYIHDMSTSDCLAPGDQVQLDIGEDNAARVVRVSST